MADFITANLISILLQFTLFGIFLILATASLILLTRRHHKSFASPSSSSGFSGAKGSTASLALLRIQRWGMAALGVRRSPLIIANILLLLSVTAHAIISANRVVVGIVKEGGGQPTVVFLTDLHEKNQVARLLALVVNGIVGDIVITYRVWLVWNHDWRVIVFPACCNIGLIVAASGMAHAFTVSPSSAGIFTVAVGPWITSTGAMTLCDNLYCTSAIAWRIWSSNRRLRRTGVLGSGKRVMEGLVIFVESATLWTAWVIFYLACYISGSPWEAIGSSCLPAMNGIAFMLITVRVGLGLGHESTRTGTGVTASALRWAPGSTSQSTRYPSIFQSSRGDTVSTHTQGPDVAQAISLTTTVTTVRDGDIEAGIDAKKEGHDALASPSNVVFRGDV